MIAIIWSRWNELIGKSLLEAAKEEAASRGYKTFVVSVSGAYEIPFALQEALLREDIKAACVLGCLIRGETPHFDCLAGPTFSNIQNLSLKYRKPVGNGILTVENLNQALERAGGKLGNKGRESMSASIELLEKKENELHGSANRSLSDVLTN